MSRFITLLATLVALALGGCYASTYDGVYVDEEPPAPYIEEIPPQPYASSVWVPGYWAWSGSSYYWIDGAWRTPPRRGYVWVRSGWILDGGRYRYYQGRWSAPSRVRHRNYVSRPARVRPRPVHRATPVRRPATRPAPIHRPAPRRP